MRSMNRMVEKEKRVDSRHREKLKISRGYDASRKRRGCRNEQKQILKGLISHVKMFILHPNDNEKFPREKKKTFPRDLT